MPDRDRLDAYLAFARERPELFATPAGGVRILLDREAIEAVEREVAGKLSAQGLDPAGAQVGIVLRDPWFYVVRDAVEFPDGSRRTHARSINRVGDGVAVLPVLKGRIVLIRHFRHAVRRWMLEVPRGGIEPGQTEDDTARQELLEEIGACASRLERLGFLHGSANIYANGAHLYFAELESIGAPQLGEGIVAIEQLGAAEFEQRLLDGEILDAFTVAAFAHARLRGLV